MSVDVSWEQFLGIAFVGVVGYLSMRVMQQGEKIDALRLEIEREFTRKADLREMLRDTIRAEIDPLKVKVEHALDEIEAGRRDTNIILEKLEWPAVRRDGKG